MYGTAIKLKKEQFDKTQKYADRITNTEKIEYSQGSNISATEFPKATEGYQKLLNASEGYRTLPKVTDAATMKTSSKNTKRLKPFATRLVPLAKKILAC